MKKTKKEKRQSFILWVTWIVVIIFGITCVGMIVNFGSKKDTAKKNVATTNTQEQKDKEEINYWLNELKENPEDPVCLANLAYSYQRANKLNEAIKYYELALKCDSKYAFAINNLAKIYLSTQKIDDAIKMWEEGLKVEQKNNEFYLGLTMAYLQKKDFTSSKKYINKLIKIDPGYILAYELKAQILMKEGNNKSAIKVLRDAKEIAKIKGESQALIRLDEAIKNLEKIHSF